jgi:hypothetical protein
MLLLLLLCVVNAASCPAQTLSPIKPLPDTRANSKEPRQLFGTFMGIGYIRSCAVSYPNIIIKVT